MRHTRNRTCVCEENVAATLLLGWTSAPFSRTLVCVRSSPSFGETHCTVVEVHELAVCVGMRPLRLAQPFAVGTAFGR